MKRALLLLAVACCAVSVTCGFDWNESMADWKDVPGVYARDSTIDTLIIKEDSTWERRVYIREKGLQVDSGRVEYTPTSCCSGLKFHGWIGRNGTEGVPHWAVMKLGRRTVIARFQIGKEYTKID